jgi:peptide/nickel transport system ATP-binding protein
MALSTPPPDATPLPEPSAPLADPEATPMGAETEGSDESNISLTIKDLRTYFYTYDGVVKALDGVTFKIRKGETTGLVGETGCGKSVTAFSVTRLIPDPPGRVMGGQILYDGADLLWRLEAEAKFKPIPNSNRVKVRRYFRRIKAADERMTAVRGRKISMIFQEPSQAMNPVFSISNQLSEVLMLHRGDEVIDQMLAATPNAPEVPAAIEEVLAAAGQRKREALVKASKRLGEVTHSPSFGTEVFYLARNPIATPESLRPAIQRAMRRLRLSSGEKRYLAYRKRLVVLRHELTDIYLNEMRQRKPNAGARRRNRRQDLVQRWSHFYYGLWGIRSRVRKPVDTETFWRSVRLLEGVSIANPAQVARGYPHELSGGMLQRVMIAMALSSEPEVLIADEPTTALDVTIQAQILDLMRDLRQRVGTAILLITHDLAVIAEVADRVCVMYAGQIVEQGPVKEVFRHPLHPYSQGLLASIPRFDQPDKALSSIPGSVPNLITPPSGCRFHPRCPYAMPICKGERPPTTVEGQDHSVACYLYHGPVAPD